MEIYYAHMMYLYNTEQEKRDIKTLEALGFSVLNPNNPAIQEAFNIYKMALGSRFDIMKFFEQYVDRAKRLAFRATPDGKIGSGVAYEITHALNMGYPVIELPYNYPHRIMSHTDTVTYLREIGQR